jgi:hypothetical protein
MTNMASRYFIESRGVNTIEKNHASLLLVEEVFWEKQ